MTLPTIKIWHNSFQKKYKVISSLSGHRSPVTSIIEIKKGLLSSSLDYQIKLWNLNTFQCERDVSTNTTCVDSNIFTSLNESILMFITKSQIGTINKDTFEIVKRDLTIKTKSIAKLSNDTVVLGCEEGAVCIYNIDSNEISDYQSNPHKGDMNEITTFNKEAFVTIGANTINIWKYKI